MTDLDPQQQDDLHNGPPNNNMETQEVGPFDSLQNYAQEPDTLAYRDDPRFRELLLHFQNAQWEESLGKINQLLSVYPENESLLAFKQDVEIRLGHQKNSKEQDVKDTLKRRRKWVVRTLAIVLFVLAAVLLFVGIGKAYQVSRLNQEATLTAQALAAKSQLADSYMQAGKPEEALRLYREIQQINPSYQDIAQKLEQAGQAVTVVNLYQQGMQALQDGKNAEALALFQQVEALDPKYKDTAQQIQKLENEQQLKALTDDIQTSYQKEDWAKVVQDYETILAIDSSIELPDLKEQLFVSYRELLLDLAGRSDLSLDDLEKAEGYYRRALALFPQDREHASERDELQKIAAELLANKYYLNGLSLLESTNYSVQGLQEALRVLSKASNIGPDSPAITSEIEKAQLFLDSYNSLLKQNWDDSINGFTKLSRKEEDYAKGRVKYFLYEAHTERGDALFAFADFEGAFLDYQEAEKIAWGDQGSPSRLFEIETRIAAVLHKLGRDKEAAEYYHFMFQKLGYQNRLTSSGEQELLSTLVQADQAYTAGDDLGAVRFYEMGMQKADMLYDQKTITVNQGDTLPNIAFQNGTTVERLRAANQFGEGMIILKDQELIIPVLSADGS